MICKDMKSWITDRKDPLSQLKASKLSIKDLLSDLLDETKGFKYQITVKILLKDTKTLRLHFLHSIAIQQWKPW